MGTLKDDLIEVALGIAAAEDAAPSDELTAVHDKARRVLYRHAEELGLTAEDVAEIDNAGPASRGGAHTNGGGPKPPADQD